jgi:hypothetical protein
MTMTQRGLDVEIGGKTYTLLPLGPEEHELLEKRILQQRITPLDKVLKYADKLSPEQMEKLLQHAFDVTPDFEDFVSEAQITQFADSRKGAAYVSWLQLRRAHPDVKEDEVVELIRKMNDEQFEGFLKKRDEALEKSEEDGDGGSV